MFLPLTDTTTAAATAAETRTAAADAAAAAAAASSWVPCTDLDCERAEHLAFPHHWSGHPPLPTSSRRRWWSRGLTSIEVDGLFACVLLSLRWQPLLFPASPCCCCSSSSCCCCFSSGFALPAAIRHFSTSVVSNPSSIPPSSASSSSSSTSTTHQGKRAASSQTRRTSLNQKGRRRRGERNRSGRRSCSCGSESTTKQEKLMAADFDHIPWEGRGGGRGGEIGSGWESTKARRWY